MGTIVLSSDNLNSQNEIIQNHKNGILFKKMIKKILKKFEYLYNLKKEESTQLFLINNYKLIRSYTLFYHYRVLKKF